MKKKYLVILAVVVMVLMLASPMAATASVQTVTRTINLDTGWDQWLASSPAQIPCASRPPGMVGWWPLDEKNGASVVTDISGFSHHGKPMPGAVLAIGTAPSEFTPGKVNGAVFFLTDSVISLFVQVPDSNKLDIGSKDFSIDAWIWLGAFKDTLTGFDLLQPIVDKLDLAPNPGVGYALYIRGNKLELVVGDGVTFQTFNSLSAIPAVQTWTHVAVTTDRIPPLKNPSFGPTVTFYINAAPEVLPAPTLPTGDIANGNDLLIGGGRLPVLFFEGGIDELEIFDREITDPEVQDIFDAGPVGKCKVDSVGGTTSFLTGESETSAEKIVALGGGTAGVLAILAWGGWYTRRRWLRS